MLDRRTFLRSSGLATLALVPVAAQAAQMGAEAPAFALGYHGGGDDARWVSALDRRLGAIAPHLRVTMRRLDMAECAHPLASFGVELLYRTKGGTTPYRLADLHRASISPVSKPVSIEVSADRLVGLRVSAPAGDARDFAFTDFLSPLLAVGHYALVGPRASTGMPPRLTELASPVTGKSRNLTCRANVNDFDVVLLDVTAA